MADIQTFADMISKIEGVKNYIFVRNDGRVIVHNTNSPETLSSMVTFAGLSSDAVKSILGTTYFKYFILSRKNGEKIFVFPIINYYLGILQDSKAYTPDVIQKIERFVNAVSRHKKQPASNTK
ncbi:hypothetical protein QUF70_06500 [Desulfobacterales bacterium HSG17]|nr:hypothetical protein [Desulfobacterales bacterium HSG17]